MFDRKKDQISAFMVFCSEVKERIDLEEKVRGSLIYNNKYSASLCGDGSLRISQMSTVKAIFKKERSWIDDPVLYRFFAKIFPEYIPYLKNETNMIDENDGVWFNVLSSRCS